MIKDYETFLTDKAAVVQAVGIEPAELTDTLYPFQKAVTSWALRKGRAAIFADCGLGKTLMQFEWTKQLNVPTLIVAPLAVAQQRA